MNSFWKVVGLAVGFSTALVGPLMVMEPLNRRGETYEYPFVLFATLWALAAAFFAVMFVMVRRVRCWAEHYAVWPMLAGCIFLLAVGVFWGGLVADQMPCFLGVPNCD